MGHSKDRLGLGLRCVLLAPWLAACSAASVDQGDAVESVGASPTELVASRGLVPYPKKQLNGVPVLTNGKPTVSWTGSLPDLLAADAVALCFNRAGYSLHPDTLMSADTYFTYLTTKMAETIGGTAAEAEQRWFVARADRTLNMNSSTLLNQAVVFPPHDNTAYRLFNTTLPTSMVALAKLAHVPQFTAEGNLCVAQSLRETMNRAASLLMTAADQREMLEIIRQRAQVAMLEFARMTISRKGGAESANSKTVGADFSAAIALHVNTTRELADVLLRSGSARLPVGGAAATTADFDWRIGSWRHRLLSLLYGGDPLAKQGVTKLWQQYGGDPKSATASAATKVPYVTEDTRASEVQTLLGLARSADAVMLNARPKTTVDTSTGARVTTAIDFLTIDVERSADLLYRAVEASLLHPECVTAVKSDSSTRACVKAASGSDVATLANYTTSQLWQRLQVSPDHARSLVRSLASAIPKAKTTACVDNAMCWAADHPGALHVSGFHTLLFADEHASFFARTTTNPVRTSSVLPNVTGTWYHLDPEFTTLPRTLADKAAGFHEGYQPTRAEDKFGGSTDDRRMGAISALVYTRDAILEGIELSRFNRTVEFGNFLELPVPAMDVITSAIGPISLSLQPSASGHFLWDVNLTLPVGMSATLVHNVAGPGQDTPVAGGRTFAQGFPATPGVLSLGEPFLSVLQPVDPKLQSYTYSFNDESPAKYHHNFFLTDEPDSEQFRRLTAGRFTHLLSAVLKNDGNTSSSDPKKSYHFADGGTLGDLAKRAWAVQPMNWARPARDGFGLPLNYVPNVDATLLGSSAQTYSADHYLSLAETAAADATVKTRAAIEALLDQEIDEQAAQNAQLEANTLASNANVGLCGAEECTVTAEDVDLHEALGAATRTTADPTGTVAAVLERISPRAQLLTPVATQLGAALLPNFSTSYGSSALKSAADEQWNSVRKARNLLDEAASTGKLAAAQQAEAVLAESNARHAVTQARTVKEQRIAQLRTEGGAFTAAMSGYDANVAAADVRIAEASGRVTRECSPEAMDQAFDASWSISCSYEGINLFWDVNDCLASRHHSFSFGPQIAQKKACTDAESALRVAQAEQAAVVGSKPVNTAFTATQTAVVEAIANVWSTRYKLSEAVQRNATSELSRADLVQQLLTRADDVSAVIQTASTSASKIERDTEQNVSEIQLRAQLAESQLRTRFGTYQRYHSADVVEARTAMEDARKYALLARRALEARFVVDLSTMTAPEFTAAAPSTWADSIYDYDLDLIASSGLSLVSRPTGTSDANTTGPTSATKITSYVQLLRNVRNHFFVNRPTQSAKNEIELFSIPGPGATHEIETNGEFVAALDPAAVGWSFYCAVSKTWIAHPGIKTGVATALSTACAGRAPDKAKFVISLDPWGRLRGSQASPPSGMSFKYNGRWSKLAVNLTGSQVLNCGADQACIADQSVRFNLRHLTPTVVSDRDQLWQSLDFPEARIEQGRAAAASLFLTAVTNSWNNPAVQNIVRTEYQERPLGGTYELELMAGPKVRLGNIDQVQILTMMDFWVKSDG